MGSNDSKKVQSCVGEEDFEVEYSADCDVSDLVTKRSNYVAQLQSV